MFNDNMVERLNDAAMSKLVSVTRSRGSGPSRAQALLAQGSRLGLEF